jgi:hypothetical protein
MVPSIVLDELDEALTNSSKVAATLDDEFLVYLIDMAVLHVRKKAARAIDQSNRRLQSKLSAHNAKSSNPCRTKEYARSA